MLTNQRTACLTLVANGANARNGSTASKTSHQLSSASPSANTIKSCSKRATRCVVKTPTTYSNYRSSCLVTTVLKAVRHPLTRDPEPNDGIPRALRLRSQLPLVHAHQHHPLPQQSRSFQAKTRSITTGKLFPRLFRRQRRQSSGEIFAVAV